jgi:predicted DNA-binding transcriptional regulator AlpA
MNAILSDDTLANWADLPIALRADFLKNGKPFPSETDAEARCRVKAALDLLDDRDLMALLGCGEEALARHRVNGTGPTPVRVVRSVFYKREDVLAWLERNRDGAPKKSAK